jgi:hypothetical protein
MKKITNKTILIQGDVTYQPRFVMSDYSTISTRSRDKIIYWIDISKHIEGIHNMVGKSVWSVRYAKPIILGEHENSYLNECFKIVAQLEPILEGRPVISLDVIGFDEFEYTLKDIEKAIELAQEGKYISESSDGGENYEDVFKYPTKKEILEQINSLSIINVDEQFNIISYE